MHKKEREMFSKVVFFLMLLLFPLFCLADIPAPYISFDFDNGFKADGVAVDKLKIFPGSEYPGI
ncbi:MAG: hypothetical protein NC905_06405, partial [Candidatus Omnitrophica bacterium]|nr:hypothetical protein [Candidatus Omnitrophota bacterium]